MPDGTDPADDRTKMVPLNTLRLDGEIYRAVSMLSYSQKKPIEEIINDMLKKHLAIEGFLKNGFQLFHKDIVRILSSAIPEERLAPEARNFPTLPKEMVILNVDGTRPNLVKYIKSFTSFMNVNGYAVNVDQKRADGTVSFYTRHDLGYKYSLFWGEIIKMTLAGLAEITMSEMTESSVYIECRPLNRA